MFSKNQLGFLFMFLSVCSFSVMDLIVKWSADYPLGEVLFFRGFFGLIPIFFLIPKKQLKNFYVTKRPLLHFNTSEYHQKLTHPMFELFNFLNFQKISQIRQKPQK